MEFGKLFHGLTEFVAGTVQNMVKAYTFFYSLAAWETLIWLTKEFGSEFVEACLDDEACRTKLSTIVEEWLNAKLEEQSRKEKKFAKVTIDTDDVSCEITIEHDDNVLAKVTLLDLLHKCKEGGEHG